MITKAYGRKAYLMIHSANSLVMTASIHLLVYKERAWLFTAFRDGHENVCEGNEEGLEMKPQASGIVDAVYQEISKNSRGPGMEIFFFGDTLFIDRLWPILAPLELRASEVILHDCKRITRKFRKLQ